MINRYVLLFMVMFGAFGMLTAMAVTLEPHHSVASAGAAQR